jgi:hypothetical protein
MLMTTCRFQLAFVLTLLTSLAAFAQAPATQPAVNEHTLVQWLAELDAKSPDTRSAAAAKLMRVSRSDLPALKKAVERSRPISPEQVSVLHDVVIHVWLTGEGYPPRDEGFLGISLVPTDPWDTDDSNAGVMVVNRMPGFAAYGALLDGDLIVEIQEIPGIRFNMVEEFAGAISRYKPGRQINLVVQRGGKQIVVPIRLSARPAAAGDLRRGNTMDTLLGERIIAAEKYYEQNFARLLGEEISRAE